MMWRDLHYAWPWAANLFFFGFLFAFLLWNLQRYRQRVVSANKLILQSRSRLSVWIQGLLFIIAWIGSVVAVMQPLAHGHYPEGERQKKSDVELRRPAHEVVLLADVSASMAVKDMHNGQTRLQYLKQLADEFIGNLNGEQVTLYAMTSDVALLSPPTLDYLFVRLMLNTLQIDQDGETGTDYYGSLAELRKHLMRMPLTTLKTVILLTDGGDTAIETAKENEKATLTEALLQLITDYLKLNARIYTVGMGSIEGGTVPGVTDGGKPVVVGLKESLLKRMADTGRGKYLNANNYTVIDAAAKLAEEVNELSTGAQGQDIMHSVAAEDENLVYDHYFAVPLVIAIVALLLALYFPETRGTTMTLFLLAALPLNADEVRSANIWLEASQYAKASGSLEGLSDSKLPLWQVQVTEYNKGVVLLHQRQWEQAIAAFSAIELNENSSPTLAAGVETNLGIAYLERARALEALPVPPYPIILALQEEAITAFHRAGLGPMSNADASFLGDLAFTEQAISFGKSSNALLKDSSLREGLPLLLFSLNNAATRIRFLDRDWMDQKFKELYLQIFKNEQKRWELLWETQQRNWEETTLDEGKQLFGAARASYIDSEKAMQNGAWKEALAHLEEASSLMTRAMRLLFGESQGEELLQRLLGLYHRLLNQDLLTEGALSSLKKEQEQLNAVVKSEEISQSLKEMEASLSAVRLGDKLRARFFLEAAQEWIRRSWAKSQRATPEHIIEETIAKEAFVARLLRLRLEMKNEEFPSEEYWKRAQDRVLEAAARLLPIVLEQQTKIYRSKEAHRCQARPWDEVLPLFEKGREEAGVASIKIKDNELRVGLEHAARAILHWQQALAVLRKPVTDKGSPCQSQGKPKDSKESTSAEEQQKTPQPQSGVNDILRTLQEINEEDQLPKTDRGIKKSGLRPW